MNALNTIVKRGKNVKGGIRSRGADVGVDTQAALIYDRDFYGRDSQSRL